MSRIDIGIVGCGNAARKIHYKPLAKCKEKFRVVACCDVRLEQAEEVGRLYDGAQSYQDLTEFLKHPGLRLVLVTTKPPSTHAEVGLRALEAGKDVVLEKPMCGTHEEGVALIDAAQRHGRMLTVHHNRRWEPAFLELRWAMEQGFFGDVRMFGTMVCGNLLSADWLMDWGVHLIDQALLIGGGEPVEVSCAANFPEKSDSQSGPWTAFIRFKNGRVSVVTMLTSSTVSYPRFYISGDKGGCVWPGADKDRIKQLDNEIVTVLPEIGRGADGPALPVREAHIPYMSFYDNLYEALNGRAEPAVRPAEALRVMDVTLAAIESTRTGRSVLIK